MRHSAWKSLMAAGLSCGLAAALASGADAEERVRWKMHAAFTSKLPVLGDIGVRVAKQLTELSQGTLQVRRYEPNALVPAYNYLDALTQGSIDAAAGASGIHVSKNAAFAFFTAVPFGPNAGEFLAWLKHGGGNALMDELYGRFNVKAVSCGMLPPEASGWFRKEVKSLQDLSGLKIRFFGYGGKVLEQFGVSAQLLAGGDIYPALELGTIDATEFSMPAADEVFGFHQIAKHYYFPGWHQPSSLQVFEVHKPHYDGLSDHHRMLIDTVCGYSMAESIADGEAAQFPAMHRLEAKGVTLHRWPDDVLDKLQTAWVKVIEEDAAKDPDVKAVWDSLSAFRREYAVWGDMGYVK